MHCNFENLMVCTLVCIVGVMDFVIIISITFFVLLSRLICLMNYTETQ